MWKKLRCILDIIVDIYISRHFIIFHSSNLLYSTTIFKSPYWWCGFWLSLLRFIICVCVGQLHSLFVRSSFPLAISLIQHCRFKYICILKTIQKSNFKMCDRINYYRVLCFISLSPRGKAHHAVLVFWWHILTGMCHIIGHQSNVVIYDTYSSVTDKNNILNTITFIVLLLWTYCPELNILQLLSDFTLKWFLLLLAYSRILSTLSTFLEKVIKINPAPF